MFLTQPPWHYNVSGSCNATFVIKHVARSWFHKHPSGSACASLGLLVFYYNLGLTFLKLNVPNLLCFLHWTVLVHECFIQNSCKHLGKWKFALEEKVTLTGLFSSAKELFHWVSVMRNAEILAALVLYHTSRPKVTNRGKVPGPNRKKKYGCESFIPITPMLPNEPPRWHKWIKRHMNATSQPFDNSLFDLTQWYLKAMLYYHLPPTKSKQHCIITESLDTH